MVYNNHGYWGGGVWVGPNAEVIGTNVQIYNNTASTFGGGVRLYGSHLSLENSDIHDNTAPLGGGVYGTLENTYSPVLDLTSTVNISDNQALTGAGQGGGVFLREGTFTLAGGSAISSNDALQGGGVYLDNSDMDALDVFINGNTSTNDGGGIYINAGTLDFSGGWTLRENTAGGSGGGVAVLGSATAEFRADRYSLVYFNRAQGGHGGFLYLNNNTTVKLYATAGAEMYVYANHASDNGGALYADSNGYFDVYGQVNFDRNRADHGGAIYLSNGSRVWLDDYVNDYPQLWDNFADYGSGGAIYAVDSPSVRCDGAIFGQSDDGNHAAVSGGAIYLDNSALIAENCTFQANQAQDHGGAIAAFNSTLTIKANLMTPVSLAMEKERNSENIAMLEPAATIRDPLLGPPSRFRDNVADNDGNNVGDGGAIYLSDSSLQMDQTVLDGNNAERGGAIYQDGAASATEMRNSLIYSNTVATSLGAGIRVLTGNFSVRHVTLADNINGAGFSAATTSTSAAFNSIAWGNDLGGFWGTFAEGVCNIDQSGTIGGNIDPLFFSPGTNYNLLPGSPAIDACATGLPVDLIARARPVGAGYDIGAYEWTNLLPAGLHEGSNGTVGRTGCNVSGWTMDPNLPDREVQVRVLSDATQVATGSATLYRADLEDTCPGGTCGFSFELWGLVSAGVEHAITVQAYDEEIDDWADLEGTPKSLTCWGYPEGQHEGDEGFGGITTCRAVGWVGDPDDPDRDVTVRVEVNGALLETVIANQDREGLDPLLCPGGTCAFTVDLWGRIPFNVENTISVRAYDEESDDWYDLAGTPKTLTCPGSRLYLPAMMR
jgi:predicted outer membrane repeat protein